MKWQKIDDSKVRHVWVSVCDEDCESHRDKAKVPPNYYEDNGEPSCCSCGKVYNYSHTEIND